MHAHINVKGKEIGFFFKKKSKKEKSLYWQIIQVLHAADMGVYNIFFGIDMIRIHFLYAMK